jgi:hypothetical protein
MILAKEDVVDMTIWGRFHKIWRALRGGWFSLQSRSYSLKRALYSFDAIASNMEQVGKFYHGDHRAHGG